MTNGKNGQAQDAPPTVNDILRGFRLTTLALALLLAGMARAGDSFTGKVVGVTDGDTITVLDDSKTQHKIRLQGIDAPEKDQAFGNMAKHFASGVCFGKTVTVNVITRDKYQREVAEVILPDGGNLNQKIVAQGLAWWYRQYAPADKALANLEKEAKEARRGLWADANPTPPWEWRHPDKSDSNAKIQQSTEDTKTQPIATGYWLNTKSNARHNQKCRYYQNTKEGRPCGPNEGKACGLCGG